MKKNVDILLLQEIKFVQFSLDINLKCIWRDSKHFFTKHPKGKGGAANLICNKWAKFVKRWGCSPCNRVVWIILQYKEKEFGIAFVYAPNDHREQVELWNWLAQLEAVP